MAAEFSRFLIVGGTTTLLTYLVYLVLIRWIGYELAYAAGYGLGVLVSYVLSTRYVFRQPMTKKSALRFPLVYLAQFLVGLMVLHIAVEVFGVPVELAPVIAVAATIPVTFLLSRTILRRC